jgi:hypothetical protein
MERKEDHRIVEAADAEAASALSAWLMSQSLGFEFVAEHDGRQGYFFQVPAAVKLGGVGPRLRLRLSELSVDEAPAPPVIANLTRRRSR